MRSEAGDGAFLAPDMPNSDEKARAWTRPEDYWPPRRPARIGRSPGRTLGAPGGDRGDPTDAPRLLLGLVPYFLLMASLAVVAVAIMIAAWPGSRAVPAAASAPAAEIGTAPKGWMDQQ